MHLNSSVKIMGNSVVFRSTSKVIVASLVLLRSEIKKTRANLFFYWPKRINRCCKTKLTINVSRLTYIALGPNCTGLIKIPP